MRRPGIPLSIWILPAVILASFLIPFFIWFLLPSSSPEVLIYGPGEREPGRMKALSWPVVHSKGELMAFPSGRNRERGVFVLETSVSSAAEDEEALRAVNRIKDIALRNRSFVCDGHLLNENTHSLFRSYMEEFLQVDFTGWTVIYSRSSEPELQYFHSDGRSFVLKGESNFSGRAPTAAAGGKRAPVYSWMSVYRPSGTTKVTYSLDLHLTDEGRSVLREQGIPVDIPLVLENRSALVDTAYFTLDLSRYPVEPGSFRFAGKLFFRSWISLFVEDNDESVFWRAYVPWFNSYLKAVHGAAAEIPETPEHSEAVFTADGEKFYRTVDGKREEFFIKGVNLGPALPGTWGTQFPRDEHLYYRWFRDMTGMNLNTLRVYTLLPPDFYRAFRNFNEDNPDTPLYLIQEIWPEEYPENNNYLGPEYNRTYRQEIRYTIDALHGRGDIPYRTERAWGRFTADISPWLLAWLVGREMEPEEVLETNALNPGSTYRGEYISAPSGPAVESWLAASCDLSVSYEITRYGKSRPVGMVSWPILDALHHEVEWRDPELKGKAPHNDKAVVDIRHMTVDNGDFGGFFGAYHIYPNYPDFINNQSSFASWQDEKGVFRYGGYLKEFMAIHSGYPALIAEYGISTSAVTAHISPDGYNHGGLSEETQAEGIIRMTDAIVREGYAGAVIFEWIDEWQKKTWTTEPFMIPYDRQALWHNVLDPEQNYGITAMRAAAVLGHGGYTGSEEDGDERTELSWWGSESHLYLELKGPVAAEGRLFFGFDTIDPAAGIRGFPGIEGFQTPTGMESMVVVDLSTGEARFQAASDYNIGRYAYQSGSSPEAVFEDVRILVNRETRDERWRLIPAQFADWSSLKLGRLDEAGNALDIQDGSLVLRIPWGLMNVSDPSSGRVLDDPGRYSAALQTDQLQVRGSSGIRIYGLLDTPGGRRLLPGDFENEELIYRFNGWDVPLYREEEKKSIPLLRRYFGEL